MKRHQIHSGYFLTVGRVEERVTGHKRAGRKYILYYPHIVTESNLRYRAGG